MANNSGIEWTQATWNPLAGCSEISPGCVHCYAATMAHRLAAMGQKKYEGTTKKLPSGKVAWTGKMNLDHKALSIPLKKKKPTTWFVNSMSDLFHEDVPDEFIDEVFTTMCLAEWHTFQVLTKRANRMVEYFSTYRKSGIMPSLTSRFKDMPDGGILCAPLNNVWLGVSVENKQHGLPRITHLLQTPAAVRFLSIEPLLEDLGQLDLLRLEAGNPAHCICGHGHGFTRCPNTGGISKTCHVKGCECKGFVRRPGSWNGIDWIIAGGESGHGARPMNPDWVRSIRDQCVAAGVPFFFKQWGGYVPLGADCGGPVSVSCSGHPSFRKTATYADGTTHAIGDCHYFSTPVYLVGKAAAGRLLDGREWNEMPAQREQVPA